MPPKPKKAFESETRRRLIDAAGELFAEKGYDATTVRDICEKAGTNIASVNYHFSGKLELYEATFQFALMKDTPDIDTKAEKSLPPDEKLYNMVLRIVQNIRMTDKPEWFSRLLRREILFPTEAFQDFVQRMIKEDFDMMANLIRQILPKADNYAIKACTLTLSAQIKSIAMENNDVLSQLFPELSFDEKGCQRIARHIAQTSMAGMKACYGLTGKDRT